ncbi:undecaprenyl-diphosphate phosphatase [Sinobaca sp. H24]|uniref:undecaprenyl-diphosphate phosphatase n=1 Tax=Sinobaca sp. H24 TaxID=2923376 RepID=UPI0020794AA3|nr:undecaprenyl-diphosphate phosphatase [Sinobaca sp. H24]
MEQHGLTFEIITNTASLIAIMHIFRKDIERLAVNSIKYLKTRKRKYKSDFMFVVYIVIGTIPAAVLGLLFSDVIALYLTSLILLLSLCLLQESHYGSFVILKEINERENLTGKDALIVGLAQAVALVPGISRSGSTIITSIALGMKQNTALRFAFMLYIPVSIGGMVLGASDIISDPALQALAIPYAAAFAASLCMTYFAMRWFIGIMKSGKLQYFSYYCFIVGILLLIFAPVLN